MTHPLDDLLGGLKPPHAGYKPPPDPAERLRQEASYLKNELASLKEATPKKRTAVLVPAAMLRPEPIVWLWLMWLALGKFHLLAGPPGQGKTTIAMQIAAIITTGGIWPDGTRCPIGSVVIYTGEDDPADTLVPRLIASGADLSRVHFVMGTDLGDGDVVAFDAALHMKALREAIEAVGDVRLVILDPVVGAIQGDSHKATEVRRSLQPLVDMAQECGCAILGITHFAKGGQGSDPAQRVIGSVSFTAVARLVMVAAKVKSEDGSERRILARTKSNIGPDGGGFEYNLEQVEALPGIDASRVAWGKAVEGTAQELLTDPTENDDAPDPSSDLAACLWMELREGTTPSKTAEKSLREQGYTSKQIRTARERMGVRARKTGAIWYWTLPDGFVPKPEWLEQVADEDAPEDARKMPLTDAGHLGQVGQIEFEGSI